LTKTPSETGSMTMPARMRKPMNARVRGGDKLDHGAPGVMLVRAA
jgi:hypothetical protein